MLMLKAYKYRMYPTKTQKTLISINRWCCSEWVYTTIRV